MNCNIGNDLKSLINNPLVNTLLSIGSPEFKMLKLGELEALFQDSIDLKI